MVGEGTLSEWIETATGENVAKVGYSSLFVFKKELK